MFGLTIIRKKRVKKLQARVTYEKGLVTECINYNQKLISEMNELISKFNLLKYKHVRLESTNSILVDRTVELAEENIELKCKALDLNDQVKYQVDAIARQYEKYHRERDEKGQFIKKSK